MAWRAGTERVSRRFAPLEPRGESPRTEESGYQACKGPVVMVSASAADEGLLTQTPWVEASSRRASRGCPLLRSGISDRENEPSPLIRPWPAGVPVNTVYSCCLLLARLPPDAEAGLVNGPVCAVQRSDGGHSSARRGEASTVAAGLCTGGYAELARSARSRPLMRCQCGADHRRGVVLNTRLRWRSHRVATATRGPPSGGRHVAAADAGTSWGMGVFIHRRPRMREGTR